MNRDTINSPNNDKLGAVNEMSTSDTSMWMPPVTSASAKMSTHAGLSTQPFDHHEHSMFNAIHMDVIEAMLELVMDEADACIAENCDSATTERRLVNRFCALMRELREHNETVDVLENTQ